MVVEHILPANWMERKSYYAFFLGSFYAIIGIIIARLFFPADPSLVAVAFTSILLLPTLRKLFSIEERAEKRERTFSLRRLWIDQKDFLLTYLLIAAGIFMMYCIAAITLPNFEVSSLFREQLELRVPASGSATLSSGLFLDILANNWWVLLACFMLSFFTGDGAIFLITWNASLWGTIFGITARNAAYYTNGNPWLYIIIILAIVLPHAIIEMLSYLFASIGGGLISADIEIDRGESKKERFKKTFYGYVMALLIVALVLLVLGALLETFVLENVTAYREIVISSRF